jgi:small subunit ribosomal protein S20
VAFSKDATLSLEEEGLRKNKSAIKRAQQSEKRRLRNSHVKSTMKTHIKKALSALGQKDTTIVESTTKAANAYIDKAASKGVIHRNQAARRISRLAKKAHKVLVGSAG